MTVDDLDTKPWISNQRQVTSDGLRVAYETARVFENEAGLSWVVGLLHARDGSVMVRLCDRYTVTVFPFVEGVVGRCGDRAHGSQQ